MLCKAINYPTISTKGFHNRLYSAQLKTVMYSQSQWIIDQKMEKSINHLGICNIWYPIQPANFYSNLPLWEINLYKKHVVDFVPLYWLYSFVNDSWLKCLNLKTINDVKNKWNHISYPANRTKECMSKDADRHSKFVTLSWSHFKIFARHYITVQSWIPCTDTNIFHLK